MEKLLEKLRDKKHVAYADYWDPELKKGLYVETDTTKNSIAESILDFCIEELEGKDCEQPKFHFGIKLQKDLVEDGPKKDVLSIYAQEIEPLT